GPESAGVQGRGRLCLRGAYGHRGHADPDLLRHGARRGRSRGLRRGRLRLLRRGTQARQLSDQDPGRPRQDGCARGVRCGGGGGAPARLAEAGGGCARPLARGRRQGVPLGRPRVRSRSEEVEPHRARGSARQVGRQAGRQHRGRSGQGKPVRGSDRVGHRYLWRSPCGQEAEGEDHILAGHARGAGSRQGRHRRERAGQDFEPGLGRDQPGRVPARGAAGLRRGHGRQGAGPGGGRLREESARYAHDRGRHAHAGRERALQGARECRLRAGRGGLAGKEGTMGGGGTKAAGARQADPDRRSAAQRGLAHHPGPAAARPRAGRLRVVAEAFVKRMGTPLALAAVAVVLGGYIWFYESKSQTSEDAARDARKLSKGFERDKVTSIEIARLGGRTVVLEKKGQGQVCRLVRAVACAADRALVDERLSGLEFLEQQRGLEGKGVRAQYGLERPRVRVRTRGGGRELDFSVGTQSDPTGKSVYVAAGNEPRVFVVDKRFAEQVDKGADDLRDKRALALDRAQVATLRVGDVTLKREGPVWRLAGGVRAAPPLAGALENTIHHLPLTRSVNN